MSGRPSSALLTVEPSSSPPATAEWFVPPLFKHDGGSEGRLSLWLLSLSLSVPCSLALLLPHSPYLLTKQFCQLAAALLQDWSEGDGGDGEGGSMQIAALYGG